MRVHVGLLCLLTIASAVQAQSPTQSPNVPVQVSTLTIVSSDLPESVRTQIVQAIQGHSYPLLEISERIRQQLRDDGYAEARAEIPQLAAILAAPPSHSLAAPPSHSIDLTVEVSAGAIYRLDDVRFEGAQAFPADELRRQFAIEDGALFSATAIGKGLEQLKKLYASRGYSSFGAIPRLQMDETRRAVTLTIHINEGRAADRPS